MNSSESDTGQLGQGVGPDLSVECLYYLLVLAVVHGAPGTVSVHQWASLDWTEWICWARGTSKRDNVCLWTNRLYYAWLNSFKCIINGDGVMGHGIASRILPVNPFGNSQKYLNTSRKIHPFWYWNWKSTHLSRSMDLSHCSKNAKIVLRHLSWYSRYVNKLGHSVQKKYTLVSTT